MAGTHLVRRSCMDESLSRMRMPCGSVQILNVIALTRHHRLSALALVLTRLVVAGNKALWQLVSSSNSSHLLLNKLHNSVQVPAHRIRRRRCKRHVRTRMAAYWPTIHVDCHPMVGAGDRCNVRLISKLMTSWLRPTSVVTWRWRSFKVRWMRLA